MFTKLHVSVHKYDGKTEFIFVLKMSTRLKQSIAPFNILRLTENFNYIWMNELY